MDARGRSTARAVGWATLVTGSLGALIGLGSRNLAHFDAALVAYTFATLFASFGITYRYAVWLQRPPTRMYFRRGWQALFSPRWIVPNLVALVRRTLVDVAGNRFIFARGGLRGVAHWAIMWGCLLAAAITFPLVWGWIHFETAPSDPETYRAFVFGWPVGAFPVHSTVAFIVFHGLVWASILVIVGVMLAFRRRMIDHGAGAVQRFGEDILPLVLLLSISLTGLMLTVSYTWLRGYGYSFLAVIHAVTVIFTLLFLPFGKLFHIFQRPAQFGVRLYQDMGARGEQAACVRCGTAFASAAMVRDLVVVERDLGFRYELGATPQPGASGRSNPQLHHYQQVCPRCRRSLFGLAHAAAWSGGREVSRG